MKNTIVVVLIICFMADLSGQCLSETNTNPANPKNTDLNSLIPAGGVNEFRNTSFNWGSNASFNSIVLKRHKYQPCLSAFLNLISLLRKASNTWFQKA